MRSALATFIAVFVTTATLTLGQLVPPTEGYQLGGILSPNGPSCDIVMPITVAQCELVLIYYNFTSWTGGASLNLILIPPGPLGQPRLVSFSFPYGKAGYLEWMCNIPAGTRFIAAAETENDELLGAGPGIIASSYVVQPGASSACLGPLTTYNSDLQYYTSAFASYTATSYPPSSILAYVTIASTASFPTGAFSTLTLNLEEASGTSPTSTSTSTSMSTFGIWGPGYSPGRNQEHKDNAGKISGIVIGVVVVLVVLAISLWRRLFRKQITPNFQDKSPPYGPAHERPMDSTVATIPVMNRNQVAHQQDYSP